mgnify:CR=1 FL=1
MEKLIKFGKKDQFSVTNENIGGFLLDIDPQTGVPAIADISDLNEITLSLQLKNTVNGDTVDIYNGGLHDLLIALYQQTTNYERAIQKLTSGYKMYFSFGDMPILTTDTVELIFGFKFNESAFVNAVRADSTVNFETFETSHENTFGVIPEITVDTVGAGNLNYDERLGSNVVRAVLVTDLGATYDASNKAKPQGIDIISPEMTANISQNMLIALNNEYLSVNPDSDVRNLVVINDPVVALSNPRLKTTFDKQTDTDTRVIVVKLAQAL